MINLHPGMIHIGESDPNEQVELMVVLRRRLDHLPVLPGAQPATRADFIAKHGYHPNDEASVLRFLRSHRLTILTQDPASKQITAIGTVSDASAAFQVTLHDHRHPTHAVVRDYHHCRPTLIPELIAVHGLRTVPPIIQPHFAVNPVNTNPLSVATLKTLYGWPSNSAAGQIIGCFQVCTPGAASHNPSDIALYFHGTGEPAPTLVNVMPPDSTGTNIEANLDICALGSAAPNCTIALYYSPAVASGDRAITDPLTRMVHPWPGDPALTVISISYGFFDDGNATDLSDASLHNTLESLFMDATAQGVTVFASSGDNGTGLAAAEFGDASNAFAYVVEPSINPFCVSVGGTVVGNINGSAFEEYVWNSEDTVHATGGGVSQFFAVPNYQSGNSVNPLHINTGAAGRGVPDIAANASAVSGLSVPVNGAFQTIGGTSLAAPLMAGLLAVINAANGRRSGFIHPIIYANQAAFRDINASTLGPPNNATGGAPGYPTQTGWDGCNGMGIPIGTSLQTAISSAAASTLSLSYSDSGGSPIPIAGVTPAGFEFVHPALTTVGGTFLQVFLTGQTAISATANYTVTAAPTPGAVADITVTTSSASVFLEWFEPDPTFGPYTYAVAWGTTTPLAFSQIVAVPSITLTNLTANNTYMATVSSVGPTGVRGSPTSAPSTFGLVNPTPVTNIQVYNLFSNEFAAVQWDDVGADAYFLDYAVSSAGPWRVNPASPYTTGWGAANASPGGIPNSFGNEFTDLEVQSLQAGAINENESSYTGLGAGQNYFFRVRAEFGSVEKISAVSGPWLTFGYYPFITVGVAVALGGGRIACQWDDIFPTVSPNDGTTVLNTTIVVFLTSQGVNGGLTPNFTFGPFAAGNGGLGMNNASSKVALVGPTVVLSGITPGVYFVQPFTPGGNANHLEGWGNTFKAATVDPATQLGCVTVT